MTWEITPYTIQRDIARAVANTAAGGKVAAGYAVMREAFAGATTLQLLRDGVVVFQTTSSTPFEAGANLQIPTNYAGAPAVLSNADIDTGTWKIRFIRGSNVAQASIARSGAAFTLTDDLDTTKGILIGTNLFTLPPTLDVGGPTTGAVSASVEDWILQMTMANEGQSRFYNASGSNPSYIAGTAEIFAPSGDAVFSMTQPPYEGDMYDFGGVNLLSPWIWLDLANNSNGPNSRLEIAAVEVLGLSKTTNTWASYFGRRRIGPGFNWNANGNTLQSTTAVAISDLIATPGSSFATNAVEHWVQDLESFTNAAFFADSKALHVRYLARRARANTGPDDRAAFRPRCKVGYDLVNTLHPNFPQRLASSGASPYGRPEDGTWVGYAMDGGQSSWKLVPFDVANPDRWYSIAVSTIGPQTYPYAGWIPLWAARSGNPTYSQYFPWSAPPWTLTHAQFRSNPPPLPLGV